MKANRLGRTEVAVTELGFGGAPIGNLFSAVRDEDAHAAIDAAWEGGVRYFDTAPHYGLGLSELRLGRALAGRPRADFTISTKVGRLLIPNPKPTGSDVLAGGYDVPDALTRKFDYSRDGVHKSLEASLQRLGGDRVDIVYVHDPDDHLDDAINEAIPALVELRDQGVVAAIGAGMNTVAPLRRIVAEADVDVVMVAGRWTLVDRTAEQLIEDCGRRGVSVVSAAPFNSGLLARAWPSDDSHFDYGPIPASLLQRARTLAGMCERSGSTLPHVALRFPLLNPGVACVVAGAATAGEAAQNAAWASETIPPAVWAALREADV